MEEKKNETAHQTVEETAAEPQVSELERVTAELNDTKQQLLRMAADYDNFRKRTRKEQEASFTSAKVYVVRELLSVIDNFERAQQSEQNSLEDYKKGVDMIFEQLMQAIEKLGVESFGEVGEEFNPNFHNAVMHVEDESLGENVVSKVFQKGYKIGDSVVRHAMVETAN
ncbi:MAG: nucleotide exchange factor GrpE [Clostridia bacterium]|nr:nucleotide exchange factor GrpE [Clostridia bacterium]